MGKGHDSDRGLLRQGRVSGRGGGRGAAGVSCTEARIARTEPISRRRILPLQHHSSRPVQ
eukprot:5002811-Prymnesium_polylepis.1